MASYKPLSSSFAARDTIDVAIDLIGKLLIVRGREMDHVTRIVETEAYLGEKDPACHTFGGRKTPRTQAMYGIPGTAYVYLIYGMYHCLNVVTGNGEAILIRALEPLQGFSEEERKGKILSGPGKLCRALGITKELNQKNLLDPQMTYFITADSSVSEKEVLLEVGGRVGIASSGDAAHWPLRFGLKGSAFLSPPRF